MNEKVTRRIHRVTALITALALAFCLFFQVSKGEPFRVINPFGEDPYDAVGSFAVQGAFLVSILTYARALGLRTAPGEASRARLILRGNSLVLLAISVTLIADAIAEVVFSIPPSFYASILRGELVTMFLLTIACVVALVGAFHRVQTAAPPEGLTLADGIDDLWTLVRVPVTRCKRVLPYAFVTWVERFNSDWLFGRVPWLSPRVHPWRFACALGLVVGVGLLIAQLTEGLPPNLRIGLIVSAIFISAELGATLLGYALLGGYLGLRPAFARRRRFDSA